MALRVRKNGQILCAAMHSKQEGDTYIDDGLHYEMSVLKEVIVTEPMETEKGRGGHKVHGEWWWKGNVPKDVKIEG